MILSFVAQDFCLVERHGKFYSPNTLAQVWFAPGDWFVYVVFLLIISTLFVNRASLLLVVAIRRVPEDTAEACGIVWHIAFVISNSIMFF